MNTSPLSLPFHSPVGLVSSLDSVWRRLPSILTRRIRIYEVMTATFIERNGSKHEREVVTPQEFVRTRDWNYGALYCSSRLYYRITDERYEEVTGITTHERTVAIREIIPA